MVLQNTGDSIIKFALAAVNKNDQCKSIPIKTRKNSWNLKTLLEERKGPETQTSQQAVSRDPLPSPGVSPCEWIPMPLHLPWPVSFPKWPHCSLQPPLWWLLGHKGPARVPSPGTRDAFLPFLGLAELQTPVWWEWTTEQKASMWPSPSPLLLKQCSKKMKNS